MIEAFPYLTKFLNIYMSLPTASCEAERIFSALSLIIRKQTSINHARGKNK
jgi:hypothetical protein